MSTQVATARRVGAFSSRDWLLLSATALMWGSSFVWIEVALEHFSPLFIGMLRTIFGISTLMLFPKARAKVDRSAYPMIAAVGVLWMGAPFLLFPIAQQWIDSSVAGMINGGVPIFAGATAAIILRKPPSVLTSIGIAVGFLGVLAVGLPSVEGADSSALGVGLVLLGTIMYGVALNLAAPLQQRYGALPVLLRVQFVAFGVTLIPGLFGLAHSEFDIASFAAVIPLGCFGTALAFVCMTILVGHVGPARGSVTIYFVPVVAIVLGAVFRSDAISPVALTGTALVLLGAFLASRAQAAR
ncbi:MAG: hypothetical protein QOG16_1144 [Actinomycetota bacterium]|jgi:drug/metabolite transporter (DMT)-like permease|nr:hypothetical protein [Actinomycetota bacterium]